MSYKAMEMLDW